MHHTNSFKLAQTILPQVQSLQFTLTPYLWCYRRLRSTWSSLDETRCGHAFGACWWTVSGSDGRKMSLFPEENSKVNNREHLPTCSHSILGMRMSSSAGKQNYDKERTNWKQLVHTGFHLEFSESPCLLLTLSHTLHKQSHFECDLYSFSLHLKMSGIFYFPHSWIIIFKIKRGLFGKKTISLFNTKQAHTLFFID